MAKTKNMAGTIISPIATKDILNVQIVYKLA